jgi:hypothetical protein
MTHAEYLTITIPEPPPPNDDPEPVTAPPLPVFVKPFVFPEVFVPPPPFDRAPL